MAAEKRLVYDAKFKLKAIDYAKQYGNRFPAREFKINESMVCRWRQQEDELRLTRKTKKSFRGRKQGGQGWKTDFITGFLSKEQVAKGYLLSPFRYKPKQLQMNCILKNLKQERLGASVS
ncbi:hypothetical protein TURU_068413 [Turdus rufiventris]|nr:hypothetical protein TURU_068413 [Turdus rufiventris]